MKEYGVIRSRKPEKGGLKLIRFGIQTFENTPEIIVGCTEAGGILETVGAVQAREEGGKVLVLAVLVYGGCNENTHRLCKSFRIYSMEITGRTCQELAGKIDSTHNIDQLRNILGRAASDVIRKIFVAEEPVGVEPQPFLIVFSHSDGFFEKAKIHIFLQTAKKRSERYKKSRVTAYHAGWMLQNRNFICNFELLFRTIIYHSMKKSLIISLLALICFGLDALAEPLTVDIDDVSRVTVENDGVILTDLQNGVNTIDYTPRTYIRVTAKAGFVFSEASLVSDGWVEDLHVDIQDGLQYVDFYTGYPDEESLRIRTSATTDARSATCTITVDNPSLVSVVRKNSAEPVEFEAGVATAVKFDPVNENEIIITPLTEKPIYRVLYNSEVLPSAAYAYTIAVSDGDVISVEAMYPDVDCTLTFEFGNADSRDFINTVDLDDKPVFDFASGPVAAKLGQGLKITGDTDHYEVMSFMVNGVEVPYFNPFKLLIEGDTHIAVTVRRYASFNITLKLDDPSRVKVYQGHSYNGIEYEGLVAGDNSIEILRDTPIVSFVANPGCYIQSCSIGGYDYENEELAVMPLRVGSIVDDEILEVTTGIIVRDQQASIFIKNKAAAEGFFKFLRADQSLVEGLEDGYNTLLFYDRDNRFRLETQAAENSHIYLNDEPFESEYPESPNYRPTLDDGDVLKIFFGDEPARYDVDIEAAEGSEDAYTLLCDRILTLDSSVRSLTPLEGTEIHICPVKDDVPMNVTLDGTPVSKEDGKYLVTVTGNHKIKVSAETSGISGIATEGAAVRRYNLQGMPVERPEAGSIIIEVRNGEASKVRF